MVIAGGYCALCCQGLQKHGMHDNNRDQLLNLGMRLYQLAVSVQGPVGEGREGCGLWGR